MLLRLIIVLALFVAVLPPLHASQSGAAPPPVPPMDVHTLKNFVPIGPPDPPPKFAPADLSGDWAMELRNIGQSMSAADPGGRLQGKEPDIPYQPWALEYTMRQVSPTAPGGAFERTSDPHIHTCEPLGLGRIYMYPAKTKFVQTPDAVYILHELGPAFRVVWLNAKHPPDPDPNYWGHSIGWYENGDTLVVDTIGTNDRSWLDQMGHPRTEKLHFIERYRRVDANTVQLEMTIDDPGAYTKAWVGRRTMTRSTTGFMRYAWVCSVRDNYEHFEKVGKAGTVGDTTFK